MVPWYSGTMTSQHRGLVVDYVATSLLARASLVP